MHKILFVASIQDHLNSFHNPYMKWFKEQGWRVDCACLRDNDKTLPYCDSIIETPFERSPYRVGNLKAYKTLRKALKEGNYDIVHCHTPMASVLTRIAAKSLRKRGLKVIYTAHGFHFFKGAPKSGWLIYYPIEKWLSRYTDAIITINSEDYNSTIDRNFKCMSYLVPGIGVDTSVFHAPSFEEKKKLRNEYGFPEEAFLLFYAAEFIPRKNQEYLIRQMSELQLRIPNIQLLLAGDGPQWDEMKQLADNLGVSDVVKFLGYRRDCQKLSALSDVGVSASKQEGLPINVAEYLATGLPVVVSSERGHREMVQEGVNGFIYETSDCNASFVIRVQQLYQDPVKRSEMGAAAKKSIEKFSIENALKAHIPIYRSLMP